MNQITITIDFNDEATFNEALKELHEDLDMEGSFGITSYKVKDTSTKETKRGYSTNRRAPKGA